MFSKRTRKPRIFLAACVLLLSGIVRAASPPTTLHLSDLPWQGIPKVVHTVIADSKGDLWMADRFGGRICVFSPQGRLLRTIGSPGAGPGQIQDAMSFTLCEPKDLVAVDDSEMLLQFFTASTGKYQRTLQLGTFGQPFSGFYLTPDRIVFTGLGMAAPHEKPPCQAWTLFSTDYDGKDLRVERSMKLQTEANVAGMVFFAKGFCLPLGHGIWAVGHSLPAQIFLVNTKGHVLKASAPEGMPPEIPINKLSDSKWLFAKGNELPRAVGLVRDGSELGLVWRRPPAPGPQLSIQWYTKDLKPAGVTVLDIGRLLGPDDIVMSITEAPSRRIYLLLNSAIPGSQDAKNTLYEARLP